jgi:transcriptional regulator with XRE-family HTH domain
MESRFDRLGLLLQELRGDLSQRQFAKEMGVTHSTVQSWEAKLSWPGTQNLKKLADLRGWSLDQLQSYLEGNLVEVSALDWAEIPISRILLAVRSLPFEGAAQVAKVALETMAIKGEHAEQAS